VNEDRNGTTPGGEFLHTVERGHSLDSGYLEQEDKREHGKGRDVAAFVERKHLLSVRELPYFRSMKRDVERIWPYV